MTNVAPDAGALATTLQPLAVPLESLASMLQAVAPMLQALALSLPLSPAVLVPAALQPLAVALPVSSLPLPPTLEAPAIMPAMALVTGVPSIRVPLGTLDGKGVERAHLGGQRRRGEAQRRGEGKRRVKTCHAFLPAAEPRGSKWGGSDSDGRMTTKRSER
jgi:hypothetical protein